jgi:TonB family protein
MRGNSRLIAVALIFSGLGVHPANAVTAGAFADGLAAANRGDFAAAERLWHPLAELGDVAAQVNLAILYSGGKGVPQDHVAALWWNRIAAKSRYIPAQSGLGYMYTMGQGVPPDKIRGLTWYLIAASSSGDDAEQAKQNRDKLQATMTFEELKQANETAVRCLGSKFQDCEPSVPFDGESMLPIYSPSGPLTTPPVRLDSHAVTARDYPAVSIRLQEQGIVEFEYLIKDDGTVGGCAVIESSKKGRLDQATCAVVKRWTFKPATQNDAPVPVSVTGKMTFALR